MKKSIVLSLLTLLLLCCLTLGCVNNPPTSTQTPNSSPDSSSRPVETILPTEKEDALKAFTLDVWKQESLTIIPSEYVDANGLTDLNYLLVLSSEEIVSCTEEDGAFKLLANVKGEVVATLKTMQDENCLLETTITVTVISTEPGAPIFSQETYSYDRCAGGKLEIPLDINCGIASILRIGENRINDLLWRYNQESGCIEIDEEYVLTLAMQDYNATLTTTGGSADFILKIFNSIPTSFDEVTNKETAIGKNEFVSFDISLGEAQISKITFGDAELSKEDYEVTEGKLKIFASFFKKTATVDERSYKVYLTNNDIYSFTINVSNHLFYSDYDLTIIHNELQSSTGQNPLYQDSTRVEVVEAPENSGFEGKVLKFTPHTENVPLDVHGVYTFQSNAGSATWHKLPLNENKYYLITFDYMTEGTTAGENFAFRSWVNNVNAPLNTGKPGEIQHFSHVFKWKESEAGLFIYGKFVNGGCIYFDNLSIVELGEEEIFIAADDYKSEENYSINVSLAGYQIKEVLINGTAVAYTVNNNTITINGDVIKALPYGIYTVVVKTDLFDLSAKFNHKDPTQKSELYEKSKNFTIGSEFIKLSGLFTNDVTVTSLSRQGANNLDWINGEWQPISTSYIVVEEDGLVIKKGLLDQVYKTCTYTIQYSNNVTDTFTLTSNAVWFCNFDETYTWHSSLAEDQGVYEIVNNVEGMSGNVIKLETKNWINFEPSTWYTRLFCFEKTGWSGTWNDWTLDDNKTYEISFDMKVIMNGANHDPSIGFGYYYTTGNLGEKPIGVDYTDGEVKRVSIILKGSELSYFALGLDPRHGDLQSICYFDNFGIKEVVA